jgi:hypothetical protein
VGGCDGLLTSFPERIDDELCDRRLRFTRHPAEVGPEARQRVVCGAAAPFLAGKLAESFVPSIPFYVGAAAVFVSIAILFPGRAYLSKV